MPVSAKKNCWSNRLVIAVTGDILVTHEDSEPFIVICP